MKLNRTLAVVFALTIALLWTGAAFSADSEKQPFEPTVGQAGKDVIWVPTADAVVAKMLDFAKVTDKDYVMDLGSGDGRIVIAAAKRGATARGIEYNPNMVELSKKNAEKAGVTAKATFEKADIFATDFSKATVITMYLLPDLNIKLRPTILKMKPGTRIVSHDFDMREWEDDQTATLNEGTVHFWIVPADVQGAWTFQTAAGPAELTLKQTFQKIEPTLKAGGKDLPVTNAKLEGDKISFSVAENGTTARVYAGVVDGNKITGTSKAGAGAEEKWTAQRPAKP
jgi:SAM-dependent methyltransferase